MNVTMFIINIILFGLISKSIGSEVDVDIVKRLQTRYNDSSVNCFDSNGRTKPAYECSGLLIRGLNVDVSKMKYPWSRKELNIRLNSFSYAYLRVDQPFSRFPFGYTSGFTIYPHLKTPSTFEENKLEVFCAFPIDGITDLRNGSHGCGQSRYDNYGTSRECDVQGIDSLTKWIEHYKNLNHSEKYQFQYSQCGFDMTTESAASVFQIVMEANIYIREDTKYAYRSNELRIEAWDEENCNEIPIEAFFYLIDSLEAEERALSYRDAFYNCSGRKVPVVGLQLPTASRELTILNKENV